MINPLDFHDWNHATCKKKLLSYMYSYKKMIKVIWWLDVAGAKDHRRGERGFFWSFDSFLKKKTTIRSSFKPNVIGTFNEIRVLIIRGQKAHTKNPKPHYASTAPCEDPLWKWIGRYMHTYINCTDWKCKQPFWLLFKTRFNEKFLQWFM